MDTPSNGTKYYFVDDRGEIETAIWQGSSTDMGRLHKNNAFLNKDQAQRELASTGGSRSSHGESQSRKGAA